MPANPFKSLKIGVCVLVWPTSWEGVAIGGNVRSNAHEGQSQRYQFMKTATSRTPFRDGHARTCYSCYCQLPCTLAGRLLCSTPPGRSCTTLLSSNSISPNFLNE